MANPSFNADWRDKAAPVKQFCCKSLLFVFRNFWEGLASFTSPEYRSNKAQILQHYCETVGTCQRVNILNVVKVAGNEYKFKVQFIQDDGNVYEYTPCCGTTEENMPRQTEFDYYVHKIDGVFKVRTPPLFRP